MSHRTKLAKKRTKLVAHVNYGKPQHQWNIVLMRKALHSHKKNNTKCDIVDCKGSFSGGRVNV